MIILSAFTPVFSQGLTGKWYNSDKPSAYMVFDSANIFKLYLTMGMEDFYVL